MKYKVVISDKAKKQIAQHIAFLAQINKNSAIKLKENILTDLHRLTDMPNRYPYIYDEFIEKNRFRKMPFQGRYIAIYHIDGNTVHIDYVIDCRQDYQWLIR